jgi:hypothetical protein
MYDRVGKAAMKFAFGYLRRRYRRQAGIAAAPDFINAVLGCSGRTSG